MAEGKLKVRLPELVQELILILNELHGDIKNYTAGNNVTISPEGKISATDTKYASGTVNEILQGVSTTNRIWNGKNIKEALMTLQPLEVITTPTYDATSIIEQSLETTLVLADKNGVNVTLPSANSAKNHTVRIVAGAPGGLEIHNINITYKYFDGLMSSFIGADYIVLKSNGDNWYMIGGN